MATHQDIAQALETADELRTQAITSATDHHKAVVRNIQDECAGIGHVWARLVTGRTVDVGTFEQACGFDAFQRAYRYHCAVCGVLKPLVLG